MTDLIDKHGMCNIKPPIDNPFHSLTSSIISQQLSSHAARAIKGRLLGMLNTKYFTPDAILVLSSDAYKKAGLSTAKSKYLRGAALAVKSGELNFNSIIKYEDEDVINVLTMLSGVGRWTAEMFLIFGLGRLDVLSVNDAGLKRGLKLTYGLQQNPSADEMMQLSNPWRPYRSIACWYIWRELD